MYSNIKSTKGSSTQPSRKNKSETISRGTKSKTNSGKSRSIETPNWFWNQKPNYKKSYSEL